MYRQNYKLKDFERYFMWYVVKVIELNWDEWKMGLVYNFFCFIWNYSNTNPRLTHLIPHLNGAIWIAIKIAIQKMYPFTQEFHWSIQQSVSHFCSLFSNCYIANSNSKSFTGIQSYIVGFGFYNFTFISLNLST